MTLHSSSPRWVPLHYEEPRDQHHPNLNFEVVVTYAADGGPPTVECSLPPSKIVRPGTYRLGLLNVDEVTVTSDPGPRAPRPFSSNQPKPPSATASAATSSVLKRYNPLNLFTQPPGRPLQSVRSTASIQNAKKGEKAHFMRLPQDIRAQIYSHVLVHYTEARVGLSVHPHARLIRLPVASASHKKGTHTAILRTSKAISAEAIAVLYGNNYFRLVQCVSQKSPLWDAKAWRLSSRNLARIRHVEVTTQHHVLREAAGDDIDGNYKLTHLLRHLPMMPKLEYLGVTFVPTSPHTFQRIVREGYDILTRNAKVVRLCVPALLPSPVKKICSKYDRARVMSILVEPYVVESTLHWRVSQQTGKTIDFEPSICKRENYSSFSRLYIDNDYSCRFQAWIRQTDNEGRQPSLKRIACGDAQEQYLKTLQTKSLEGASKIRT